MIRKKNIFIKKKTFLLKKKLIYYFKKSYGKNNFNHINIKHKGGGKKFLFLLVDNWFFNCNNLYFSIILKKKYIYYKNYYLFLILCILKVKNFIFKLKLLDNNFKIGTFINLKYNLSKGNSISVKFLPFNTYVYNVELYIGKGAQLIKNSKYFCKIISNNKKYILLVLSSFKKKFIYNNCFVTIGILNLNKIFYFKNSHINYINNRRPKVRGTAMNPVDHPHGGGTGKTSIGRINKLNYWGKYFRGIKTTN